MGSQSCHFSLLLPKAGWHNHPQVLWTFEREEEGEMGYEKQERRNSPRCQGEQGDWPHQEEFWF